VDHEKVNPIPCNNFTDEFGIELKMLDLFQPLFLIKVLTHKKN